MYLTFDIGATSSRVGVSLDGKKINNYKLELTPARYIDGLDLISQIALDLTVGKKINCVAGGITGSLNADRTMLVMSRLKDWAGKPLHRDLAKIFSAPVTLENDTAVVGLGEAEFGAAKGVGLAAYITISSGIGGARLVGGKIDKSAMGFEPGHQIINFMEKSKKSRGTLEDYASGLAISKKYKKIPSNIHNAKMWKEKARILAVGLYNTILHWSPEVVVLGGGVVEHCDLSIDDIYSHLKKINNILPSLPIIKKAMLGDIGGLYGGLVILRHS